MTTTIATESGEDFRTPVPLRRHRLHWFAGRTHEVLDGIDQASMWAATPHEVEETVAELVALQSRIQAALHTVIADAHHAGIAETRGAVNTSGWVRSFTGLTGAESSRLVKESIAMESHPATRAALADGVIHTAQAAAIVTAMDALPEELADRKPVAEAYLLEQADLHDAKALAVLGKHLLEVAAPDQADELLAKALEREEADARKTSYLRSWSDGHGSRYGRFKIPELAATMLDAMVDAIANPDRPDPIDRATATTPQVRGQAFAQLIERYPIKKLPTSGGVNARVVVTLSLDTLMGGLQAATVLGTGQLLSPGHARRLAAECGVVPAVLGADSQLLDLGRRRTFTESQRLALALRQGGVCNVTGCERPATWCDANHRLPYADGGRTTLDNGELICPRHHTLVHQGRNYPRRT